jgi:hypothetical protein
MSLLQQTAIANRSRELARAHSEGGEGRGAGVSR